MWITTEGKILKNPKPITINNLQYPAQIFTSWTKEELADIGIKEIIINRFNKKWYKATGYADQEIDGVIYRTYGPLVPKYTKVEFKQKMYKILKKMYINAIRNVITMIEVYTDLNDATKVAEWTQYRQDLKTKALEIKQAGQAANTVEEFMAIDMTFPASPDEEDVI